MKFEVALFCFLCLSSRCFTSCFCWTQVRFSFQLNHSYPESEMRHSASCGPLWPIGGGTSSQQCSSRIHFFFKILMMFIMGWWLDQMISVVFSNPNDSVMPWMKVLRWCGGFAPCAQRFPSFSAFCTQRWLSVFHAVSMQNASPLFDTIPSFFCFVLDNQTENWVASVSSFNKTFENQLFYLFLAFVCS